MRFSKTDMPRLHSRTTAVFIFLITAVAMLAQDGDSAATIILLHAALAAPDWRRVAIEPTLEVYERTNAGE